ncbi:helix-turn-helix transcriptional regulator [Suttonella sp. R2A3]|uniref:helix-turn-helix transcriptional regulator n=1 Tax=Suttonella sp. R2A3 TaxID=2908648 RepID=UPI001F33F1FC|nr:AraC family transcriptional regulator [Suttonella sp. R2A3]UJF25140.1 helix-turn-helix transcriptional regulator [Suttonella sp. R2A3]
MNDTTPIAPILNKDYQFNQLHSGIRIHGGEFCAQQDCSFHQLVSPYIAFVLLLRGSVRFNLGQEAYHVEAGKQGTAIMISVGQTQLFSRHLCCGEAVRKLTLSGLERWFDPYDRTLHQQTVRQWPLDERLQQRADQLLEHNEPHALEQDMQAIALLHDCWQRYACDLAGQSATKSTDYQPQRELLCRALDEVLSQGNVEVHMVAEHLHISSRTLQRKVREYFQCSAQQWLQNARMQRALSALGEDRLSIGETAYRCGYRHPSNFIQAFRRHFGVTPSALIHGQSSTTK